MTQITVTALNNAKLDVDTIANIANSTSTSVTDRLGHTRRTLYSLANEFPNASDNAAAAAADALATAADRVQTGLDAIATASARDAALIQAGVYTTEAAGRAAVADGVAFKVQGSGDVAAYEYRRTDSSTSVLIATYPSKAAITALTDNLVVQTTATYAEYGTDAYGLLVWYLGTDGVFNRLSKSIESDMTATILRPASIQSTVTGGDTYAETWVDDYGLLLQSIKLDGTFDFQTTGIEPKISGLCDRISAKPDGVTRVAEITYIPVYGESTSVGSGGYPALSLTQPYSNLTFVGGVKTAVGSGTASFIPLVENNNTEGGGGASITHGETLCSGMANQVSELAAQYYGALPANVQFASSAPGQGGTLIAQLAKGTSYYTRLLGHIAAAKANAATLGKTFVCPAVVLIVGANDAGSGTTYAAYLAAVTQFAIDIDADIRAISGVVQTLPVMTLLYQTGGTWGAAITLEAIRKAQIASAIKSPLIEFVGSFYDVVYNVDGVHCTNAGYLAAGHKVGCAVARYLFEGRTRAMTPVSAVARNTKLTLRWDTPVVLDTTALALSDKFGIYASDSSGVITLTYVGVEFGDLVFTMSRPIVSAGIVRVALDTQAAGLTGKYGYSSNVRSNEAYQYSKSGVTSSVYLWAPACEFSITNMEF